jgi:hypothetical protein
MLTWYKDAFNNEVGEFERVVDDLTANRKSDAEWDMMFGKLKKSYSIASIKNLNDNIWSKIKNTDSWQATTINKVNKAISNNSKSSGNRDIYKVLKEVLGTRVRCPIVLDYASTYTLIAGNTRLMACRLIGITPKVIFVKG